jgi:integrase
MPKRGNGEGSIYRRKDGRWVGQYLVYKAEGPKYQYIYAKTRSDVSKKLTKAMADRDGGIVFDAGNLTLGQYLDDWLTDSVRDTVRQRTWERYESIVRVHIKPALGRIKLKALTPPHVRSLYREKLDAGLAARTVEYIHVTLHKALKDAVADALIPRNVTEAVKAPRAKGKEVNSLSPTQARAFLDAVRDASDRFEALYVLAITAGLREGELLGLKWDDVELEAGKLAVRRTLSEARSGRFFEAPKNGKGRSIRLTKQAVEALRSHRKRQNEDRLRLGALWEYNGLVFPNRLGKPMNANNLYHRDWKNLLGRAGLSDRGFTFHALRHTFATTLLRQNVNPKIVQHQLGHATISQTMDTYSHVMPDMGNVAADALEAALS